jgi:group I intron endonuclease
MTIIYKYTNRFNGKVYVGKTNRTLRERRREHIYSAKVGRNVHWGNALLRWGISSFASEILCEVPDELGAFAEILFIVALCSSDKTWGYNSTDGGEGVMGHKHSEETKLKISKALCGRRVGFFANNPIFGKMSSDVVLKRLKSRYGPDYVPRGESLSERKARRRHARSSEVT